MLSPSEFEEFVKELLEELGYEKTTQRGRSGDQGADILAEKDGERVAVQCKRYKGKVGTPEVQGLLGAMQSTESQKGFLITTAMFSLHAEKMASEVPIELIDGNKLIEWIAQAKAK